MESFDPGTKIDTSWLDRINCRDLPLDVFFVEAGRTIEPAVLEVCRSCPVRRQCVELVYALGRTDGYYGGLSPGARSKMSLPQALDAVEHDPPRDPTAAQTLLDHYRRDDE